MSGGRTRVRNVPLLSPEQQQLLSQLTASAGQGLAAGGLSPEAQQLFQTSIADPARQRFQEEALPQLLQQFVSSGSRASSPSAQIAAARGLGQLESGLAQAQGEFALGQQRNALGQLQAALGTRPFSPVVTQRPGLLQQVGGLAAGALPFLLTPGLGGPTSALGSLFSLFGGASSAFPGPGGGTAQF